MTRALPALPPPFDVLTDDVVRVLLREHLEEISALAFLQACFPHSLVVTEASQGSRIEYALGVHVRGFPTATQTSRCFLARGIVYRPKSGDVQSDWQLIMRRLRLVRRFATSRSKPERDRLCQAFKTVEGWNAEIVALAFNIRYRW